MDVITAGVETLIFNDGSDLRSFYSQIFQLSGPDIDNEFTTGILHDLEVLFTNAALGVDIRDNEIADLATEGLEFFLLDRLCRWTDNPDNFQFDTEQQFQLKLLRKAIGTYIQINQLQAGSSRCIYMK